MPEELNTQEALNLIAELDGIGVTDITLSGGEPFLRKDIWKILEELSNRAVPFVIYTNGTLLNRRRVKRLSQIGVRFISISLNGAKAGTHNFVQKAYTFKKILLAIKMLKQEQIKVQILFTLMKINAHETSDLFNLAKRLNIDEICIYPFYPVGRGKQNLEVLGLDQKTAKVLLNKILKNSGNPPYVFVGGCLRRFFSSSNGESLIKGAPCAKLSAVVTSDGHLRPCNFLSYRTKYGFRERRLVDLWQEKLFKKIRDWNRLVQPDCTNCERTPLCHGLCLSLHLDKLDEQYKLELEALS